MTPNATTPSSVDFLPVVYRQRGVKQRTYTWRIAVAIAFAAVFVATGVLQQHHHFQVRSRLAESETHYADAVIQHAKFAKIQSRLQAHRHSAELLTYLRHPWPRSGVIAAILAPMPDAITLTDCQIAHESIGRPSAPRVGLPEAKTVPADKPGRRASDLTRLLSENANRQDFVLLTGFAADATTLHEYLARLATNPLFSKIDLRSIEHAAGDATQEAGAAGQGSVHFIARAILRSGHGQILEPKPSEPGTAASAGPVALRGPER